MLSGGSSTPIRVEYEITVNQWVHIIDSADGVTESPGTYHIEADLAIPASATAVILRLLASDGKAELSLQDGRTATLLISNAGNLMESGGGGRIHCHVNRLEGY